MPLSMYVQRHAGSACCLLSRAITYMFRNSEERFSPEHVHAGSWSTGQIGSRLPLIFWRLMKSEPGYVMHVMRPPPTPPPSPYHPSVDRLLLRCRIKHAQLSAATSCRRCSHWPASRSLQGRSWRLPRRAIAKIINAVTEDGVYLLISELDAWSGGPS